MANFYNPESASDISDLLEHENAGYAGSSIVSGSKTANQLSPAEQRKKEEELRHLRIATLNTQIGQFEQEIIFLEQRIERHESIKVNLDDIEKSIASRPPNEIADQSAVNKLEKLVIDAKKEIPNGKKDIVIEQLEQEVEELKNNPNTTNEDICRVCRDGKCMTRDSIAGAENKIQRITADLSALKNQKAALETTTDNTTETNQSNQFDSPTPEFDFTLQQIHEEIKAKLNGGSILFNDDMEQFIKDNPNHANSIEAYLSKNEIEIKNENERVTHAPVTASSITALSPMGMEFNTVSPIEPSAPPDIGPAPDSQFDFVHATIGGR